MMVVAIVVPSVLLSVLAAVLWANYWHGSGRRNRIEQLEAGLTSPGEPKRCGKKRKIGKRVFVCECAKGHKGFCLVRMPLERRYLRISHVAQGPLVPFKDISSYMRIELGLRVS